MSYIRPALQSEIINGTSTDLAVTPKNLKDNVWFLSGNTNGIVKNFGTIDSNDLPFIRGNTEMMRLTSTGLGIGLVAPSTKLEIDTGISNTSGLRFTRLTSSSPTSTGQAIGVNASGDIVRIAVSATGIVSLGLDADTGTTQTLSDGSTITIAGGTGINTTVASTDLVTINIDAILDDLNDVIISSPISGQILTYSGTNWINTTPSGYAFTVAGSSGTPQLISSGNTLTIANGTGISSVASATDTITVSLNANLDHLNDVVITTPATAQHLRYNGTNWVNAAIPINDITEIVITSPTNGQFLTYNNATSKWNNTTLDGTLSALAAFNTNGILTQTAADTFVGRSILGTTNRITLTNGNGVAGDPAIDISSSYVGQTSITTLGTIGTGVWQGTVVGPTFGGTGQSTYTLGDTLYSSATNTLAKLAGNTTTTRQFLSQTGNGSISAAPSWQQIAETDIADGSIFPRLSATETISGTYTFNNNIIVPLVPTLSTHATSKSYVDGLLTGVKRLSVRAATTTNGTLAIAYQNGSVIDTVTLVTGDRILLKNQSTQAENGIYTVNAGGAPTRSTDMDVAGEVDGTMVVIEDGGQASQLWLTVSEVTTIGTDPIVFTQINKATDLVVSNGLNLSGLNLKLGGTLDTNTTITQSTFHLVLDQNSTGKFGIAIATPLSGFDNNTSASGGAIRTIAASATLTDTDYMVLCNATSGAVVVTLPTATGIARREYIIKKIDSSANTVSITSAVNIDGASTYTITSQYNSIKVKSNGTQWYIF